ncbi:MAG TPA: hypothetical protein VFB78_07005 [Acidimicrobiales bacterium]|nr:hypothetical protein [Acidimicrobiales bacterium]
MNGSLELKVIVEMPDTLDHAAVVRLAALLINHMSGFEPAVVISQFVATPA